MLISELLDHYKSWIEITRSLGLCTRVYQGWLKKGTIPYRTQQRIEKVTGGKFKARKDEPVEIIFKQDGKYFVKSHLGVFGSHGLVATPDLGYKE